MVSQFNENYLSLKDVENGMRKCNYIKYAAYRTAAKLRLVQKAVFMDKVSLKVVSNVFERHRLQQTENSVHLDQREVDSVSSDIYFVVQKENNIPLNVDHVSKLLFNILLNVFDKKTSNTLQVFSLKVGLTLLCQAKPREKYHYLFEQLADHNNCISRRKLELLLRKMIKLTEYLGERLSFGHELIPGTVESCFKCNIGSLGVSEDVFMSWLMQDPQLLVWLSTFYRMQISHSVSHNAKCGLCKVYPLVGLRYRCLRCLAFDMCQSCFFSGKHNKKHKLRHPVQEYCCPMTPQQSTKAFLLTLRNMLYRKDSKLQYLPALRVDSCCPEALGQTTQLLDDMEISSRTVINGSRMSLHRFSCRELQNIILHLETESEKIIPQIESFCKEMDGNEVSEYRAHLKSCLLKHRAQIKTQIQRLNLLRNYLASKERFGTKAFLASTPVVDDPPSNSQKTNFNVDLGNFSPITVRSLKSRQEARLERKMLWDNYDLGSRCWHPSWEEVGSAKPEGKPSVALQEEEVVVSPSEETWKGEESELELSCWLGGRSVRAVEGSSVGGCSWLQDEGKGEIDEDKIRKENEETFEELQSELKRILNKLQQFSMVPYQGDFDEDSELEPGKKSVEIDVVAEIDLLLTDLITGMEKLVGN